MSLFTNHVTKWRGCTECLLHQGRKRMVFCRGKLPCDILFIGEAPGASEDVLGVPFIGPAGKLLDDIIKDSVGKVGPNLRYALTNLVCCIPLDSGEKGQPPKEAIEACKPRLLEFIELAVGGSCGAASPRLIVCVGDLSRKWVPEIDDVPQVYITHPAAILRMDVSQKALAIRRCIVTLAESVDEHFSD